MYEAIDEFFTVNTWDLLASDDQARFFRALNVIVRSPDFSLAKFGDYLDKQHGQNAATDTFEEDKASYMLVAEAIWKYLKAIR
jgi:hypothetical protein